MIDASHPRFIALAAFVATGLSLVSLLMLLSLCVFTLAAPEDAVLGDRIPLVFVLGTIVGWSYRYARWEHENLRLAREEAAVD